MQRLYKLLELRRRPFLNKSALVKFERTATAEELADYREYKDLIDALEMESRQMPVGTKVAYLHHNDLRFGELWEQPEPGLFTAGVINRQTGLVERVGIQEMERHDD